MKLILFDQRIRYVGLFVATGTALGFTVARSQTLAPATQSSEAANSSPLSDPRSSESPEKRLAWAEKCFDDEFYESARYQFQIVVYAHPENQAARAGLDKAEQALAAVQNRTPQEEADADKLRRKLQGTIAPQVFLDYTRLRDALEFLRQESIRLDKETPLDQQGIKFFVRFPATTTPDTPVSLRASNVSLLDALRQVLDQAGMVAKVYADGVYLTGRDEVWPEKLITREFRVDPQTFAPAPGETNASSETVEAALKAGGVPFPTGAAATYLPATRKLVIRNTAENIEVAELITTGLD